MGPVSASTQSLVRGCSQRVSGWSRMPAIFSTGMVWLCPKAIDCTENWHYPSSETSTRSQMTVAHSASIACHTEPPPTTRTAKSQATNGPTTRI